MYIYIYIYVTVRLIRVSRAEARKIQAKTIFCPNILFLRLLSPFIVFSDCVCDLYVFDPTNN